jgi:outer membrane protein assembly factor BamD (BamD/ComL family)
MEPQKLYKIAMQPLHKNDDREGALSLFKKIVQEHPDSEQAQYAKTMIDNIEA